MLATLRTWVKNQIVCCCLYTYPLWLSGTVAVQSSRNFRIDQSCWSLSSINSRICISSRSLIHNNTNYEPVLNNLIIVVQLKCAHNKVILWNSHLWSWKQGNFINCENIPKFNSGNARSHLCIQDITQVLACQLLSWCLVTSSSVRV